MALFPQKKPMSAERKKGAILRPLTTKSKNGLFSSTLIAITVVIVLVLNLAIGQIPESVRRLDMSSSKAFSISDVSKEYMEGLTQDVTLTVVSTKSSADSRVVSFLQRYGDLSDHLTVTWIDPVAYPSALTEYDCSADTVVVSCEATGQTRQVSFDDMLVLDQASYYYYQTINYTSFDGEGQLTSAVDYVVSSVSHKVYTTQNHGEAALGTTLSDRLEKNHFTTETLSLLQTGSVPEDCDLLIINSPNSDFSAEELKMVQDYLDKGGKVNLLVGDMGYSHPNLDALLTEYGLQLTTGYVGDTSRYYPAAQSYFAFFPELDSTTNAAEGVSSDALVLTLNSYGFTEAESIPETVTHDKFLKTSTGGVMLTSGDSTTSGVYLLGVTATKKVDDDTAATLTVCTESLTSDSIAQQFGDSVANLTVFVNTITTSFPDVSNISIEAKSLETPTNTMTNAGLWGMLFVAVLPLTVLIVGGFRWWTRRRL